MNILVIGGTGFMGPFAVRELVNAGHKVTVFHRGKTNHNLPQGIQEIHSDVITRGNRSRLPELTQQFKAAAPDVVLDMLLATQEDARITVELFRDFARRIVVASSCDVYGAYGRLLRKEVGEPLPFPATERSPLRTVLYPYRQEKLRSGDDPTKWMDNYDKILVEKVILSQAAIAGTVIRLPMVYGEYDPQHRLYGYLKRIQDKRPVMVLESTLANWRTCRGYVGDMGHALALAVMDERAVGKVYNVAENDAPTELEWLQRLTQIMNWQGRIITVSAEQLPEALRDNPDFRQNLTIDSNCIREELGYTEQYSLQDRLRRAIAWETANPPNTLDPALFNYSAEDAMLAEI